MRLVFKFNLVLLIVFGLGLAGAGLVSHRLLYTNARAEVLENARMIMASAMASRSYTSTQIAPLLARVPGDEFLPQTVPAFGATEQFNGLHSQFPDFSYKEATINPTNLRDKASDWEADVVKSFQQKPDEKELIIDRETPTGATLSLAKPIQIEKEACLVCHSTIDAAPKPLLEKYGPANGFGWQLHSDHRRADRDRADAGVADPARRNSACPHVHAVAVGDHRGGLRAHQRHVDDRRGATGHAAVQGGR